MKKYLITAGLLVMCSISFAANERLCARGMDGDRANANVDAQFDFALELTRVFTHPIGE